MARMFQGHMVTDEQFAEFTKVAEEPEAEEAAVEEAVEEGVEKPRRQRRSRRAAEAAIAQATGKVLSVDSEESAS